MDQTVKNVLRTKNEIYEFEALWTVENFLLYPTLEKDEYLSSYPFSSNKAKWIVEWKLDMYPNGLKTEKGEGLVGLFLKIQQLAKDVEGVLADFDLAIVDVNAAKQKIGKVEKHFFRNDGQSFGIPSFVSRVELEKQGNDLLANGNLTVECHIMATFKYKVECRSQAVSFGVDGDSQYVSETLTLILEEAVCSDVVLRTDGAEFKCHKSVLSARSPYFRAMFSHDMKENSEHCVDLSQEMDATELKDLINFFYKGKAPNLHQTCYTLYHVADVYSLAVLKNLCETELINKVTSESAWDLLEFAKKNNAKKLQILAARCIWQSS